MKLLKEITEQSVGIEPSDEILERTFLLRKSARGILLNDAGDVSLQLVGKYNFYKLPGGGVDAGETEEEALRREIIEEVGCDITIAHNLGITIEYRNRIDLLHISYGYIAYVAGDVCGPSYEQGEIDDGYEPVWVPLKEAAVFLTKHRPAEHYEGKFIVERELAFLSEALHVLK